MAGKRPAKKAQAKTGPSPANSVPSTYRLGGVTLQLPDSPLTPHSREPEEGIPSLESDEVFTARARSQQQYFLELADRIERGDDSLMAYECLMIAGAVRAYAAQIYIDPPRRRGAKQRLNPLPTIAQYLQLRHRGMKHSPAVSAVAEELDVSNKAIEDLLKKYKEQVGVWLDHLAKK